MWFQIHVLILIHIWHQKAVACLLCTAVHFACVAIVFVLDVSQVCVRKMAVQYAHQSQEIQRSSVKYTICANSS